MHYRCWRIEKYREHGLRHRWWCQTTDLFTQNLTHSACMAGIITELRGTQATWHIHGQCCQRPESERHLKNLTHSACAVDDGRNMRATERMHSAWAVDDVSRKLRDSQRTEHINLHYEWFCQKTWEAHRKLDTFRPHYRSCWQGTDHHTKN